VQKQGLILILIILCNLLNNRLLSSEWDFNKTFRQAYTATLSLQFNKADSLMRTNDPEHQDNNVKNLIQNYQDFLSIFILEEEQLFEEKETLRKERIKQLESLPDDEPYKKWSLAVINLQWAFSRLKFKEYFTAALEIRRAYFLLKANQEQFPDFAPNLLGTGILNAILGTVPPEYEWVLNLSSMEGSIPEGRKQLWQLIELGEKNEQLQMWIPETLFYLSFIEINFSADPLAAQKVLSKFNEIELKTPLLLYAEANLLMKTGDNEKARHLLESRETFQSDIPFHFLDYLYAESLSRKLDKRSQDYYHSFESNFQGINYKADALRKIAWMTLIQGDTTKYLLQLKDVLKYSSPQIETDKQAIDEAKNQIIYHPELLKARLLFDGGYYLEANAVMNRLNTSVLQEKDLLELYYRKGRVADQLNMKDVAIENYYQTMLLGAESPEYYAANAALKLGELFENEGQFSKAIEAYEKCLTFNPETYRMSIHQKARAGIKRVQKK
jgi:tetratricopeptide (TPR) repeat protein